MIASASPPVNDEGFLDHAYIPSFMHDRKRDYPRSFGYQFNYQNHRAVGWARSMKGMGKSFKEIGEGALSGVHHRHRLHGDDAQSATATSISTRRSKITTACPARGGTGSSPMTTGSDSTRCRIGAARS